MGAVEAVGRSGLLAVVGARPETSFCLVAPEGHLIRQVAGEAVEAPSMGKAATAATLAPVRLEATVRTARAMVVAAAAAAVLLRRV